MIRLLDNRKKKIIVLGVASLALIVLIGFVTYAVAIRLLPQEDSSQSSKTITDPDVANKTYQGAISAEEKNDYVKATELYEQALPYYKSKSEESIADKNTAYGIEARIEALKKHEATLKTLQAEASKNPALIREE